MLETSLIKATQSAMKWYLVDESGSDVADDQLELTEHKFEVLVSEGNHVDILITADCEGHPAGPHDSMGETVYCDGSCQQRRFRLTLDEVK